MNQETEYQGMLSQLLAGAIRPSSVIGKGYKNPKSVASGWLRTQLHNLQNPNATVSQIHVSSTGKAFTSERKAMHSPVFKLLVNGKYTTINSSVVIDYGVIPSTIGDGIEIYVVTQVIRKRN